MKEILCLLCEQNNIIKTRGLCNTCYMSVYRAGDLELYPTNAYLENPRVYIQWAFEHDLMLLKEIASEHGYKLSEIQYSQYGKTMTEREWQDHKRLLS